MPTSDRNGFKDASFGDEYRDPTEHKITTGEKTCRTKLHQICKLLMVGFCFFSMTHLHCLLKWICTAASSLHVNVVDQRTFFPARQAILALIFSATRLISIWSALYTGTIACTTGICAVIVTLLIKDANLATNKDTSNKEDVPDNHTAPTTTRLKVMFCACVLDFASYKKILGGVQGNRRNAKNGCAWVVLNGQGLAISLSTLFSRPAKRVNTSLCLQSKSSPEQPLEATPQDLTTSVSRFSRKPRNTGRRGFVWGYYRVPPNLCPGALSSLW